MLPGTSRFLALATILYQVGIEVSNSSSNAHNSIYKGQWYIINSILLTLYEKKVKICDYG